MRDGLAMVAEAIHRYRKSPVVMVREQFGVEPDAWQKIVLERFALEKRIDRIAMSACAGPGKSAVMSWMGWNAMLCHGSESGNFRGAAISVTADNLADNLWAEFYSWYNRSDLLKELFGINSKRLYSRDHKDTWWISARSFRSNASGEEQAQSLSGLHAERVIVLVDESSEISPHVARRADQAMGGPEWGRVVQSGNPRNTTGMLYEAVRPVVQRRGAEPGGVVGEDDADGEGAGWFVMEVTADPDDPNRTPRVDKEYVRAQIERFGRHDPWVMVFFLGQFPPGGLNTLISEDDVLQAMQRDIKEDEYMRWEKRLGIDAARFGDDPWAFFPRQGRAALKPQLMRGPVTQDVVRKTLNYVEEWGAESLFFDSTGGWSVGAEDGLNEVGQYPIPVNFSSTKTLDERYYNVRAEIWCRMCQWIESGGALPFDMDLKEELCSMTYGYKGNKKILESKDKVKKRLGRSPNKADALAVTFYHPERTSDRWLKMAMGDLKVKEDESWDYDPIEQEQV